MNASGSRYRTRSAPTTSRTIACSYSVPADAETRAGTTVRVDICAIKDLAPGLLHRLIGEPLADRDDFFAVPRQEFHEPRIEMLAGLFLHVDERVPDGPRGLVGAHRGQRVVDVRDRDDARLQRNVIAFQAGGIAGPVVLLVMAERDHRGHLQVSGRAVFQHVVADARVGLHDAQVLAVEPSRVLQDPVRNADLSYVVHRCGQLDRVLLRRGQSHASRDQGGVLGHPYQVHSGHLVALLGGLREAKQRVDFAPPQFTGGLVDLLFEDPGPVLLENFMPAQAQQIAAPRSAFEPVYGAGQKVGGSGLQRPVADFAIVHYRDAHDRNVLVAEDAAQAADRLDAVQVRHLVIGEHHVDRVLARVFDRLHRVGEG